MISYFRKFFNKPKEESLNSIEISENIHFILKIGKLIIGNLTLTDTIWSFHYSEEFKSQDKYSRLVGFSDINKTYNSKVLWPFFKIRIPGLKQPMIQEIIEAEDIDENNEAHLLKRFGRNNISNPYILDPT